MKSFVVNMQEFFSVNRETDNGDNFKDNKQSLLIPMYQREYKWENDKIEGLVHDINAKAKFLEIIILDERKDCYKIVDGQQRITTCFLIMMALFNLYKGAALEQKRILKQMAPYGSFVLKNDSIGDFISISNDVMSLAIDGKNDIYAQEKDFERAYDVLYGMLTDGVNLREFHRHLKDCTFLIMINDEHKHSSSIEQIFLDINEKTQELDVEDIFKGHCFEIYDEDCHTQLKDKWVELKKCGSGFRRFGYKDLSVYLYLYILERDGSIPEKLTISGKHYLEGKNMDETEQLLKEMIDYGKRILLLRSILEKKNRQQL